VEEEVNKRKKQKAALLLAALYILAKKREEEEEAEWKQTKEKEKARCVALPTVFLTHIWLLTQPQLHLATRISVHKLLLKSVIVIWQSVGGGGGWGNRWI